MNLTLPTDSNERKEIPIASGCLAYFPAALAGVARVSKAGNDKHNKGEPLHHARGKSMDHADCIVRHLMDVQDLRAVYDRNTEDLIEGLDVRALGKETAVAILAEASQLCWRALALSQELHERFGSPLAPGARLPESFCLESMQVSMKHREADLAARSQQIKDDIADQRPEWQARPEPAPSPYAGKIAENVCASVAPTPGFPITPGLYRACDGRVYVVERVDNESENYPARDADDNMCWTLEGHFWADGRPCSEDLIDRVADLPTQADPPHAAVIAPCPPPPLKLGFPVTPGVYRSRKGQLWTVARIKPPAAGARPYDYPAREVHDCMCWTLEGRYWVSDEFSEHDLVERVADFQK